MDCLTGFTLLVGHTRDEPDNRHMLVSDVVAALNSFAVKDHKTIKTVVQKVRDLLNNPSYRLEGLTYLSQLVQQSTFPVFDDNYQAWFQDVRQFIKNDAGKHNCLLAVKILCVILECGVKHPDSLRWLGLNVGQYITQLLALNDQHDESVALGLNALITHLPGACKTSLGKIDRCLMLLLLSGNAKVVELASSLLARFPFSSQGGGEGGTKHAEAWLQKYDQLCASLHATLNDLYHGLELERHDVRELGERLTFPNQIEEFDNIDFTSRFLTQYREAFAFCKCLSSLLNVEASVPLAIPIERTLYLVCRIFKVNGRTIASRDIQDSRLILLYNILPLLHAETMRFLENLIINCTTHMLVHDATIQGLIQQTLYWTSCVRAREDRRHSLGKLRQSAYQMLSTWISVGGGSADLQVHGDKIVGQLLKDIAVVEATVSLAQHEVKEKNTKKPPKAKRQRMDPNLINASASRDTIKEGVDPATCVAALKTLRVLLYSNADDLLPETHKEIQTCVTKVLSMIQRSQSTSIVYADPGCRRALYSALHAAMVNDPFLNTSQLASSIHWFSNGKLDGNVNVRQTCIEALTACRLMINPVRRIFSSARVVVETVKESPGVTIDDEDEDEEMVEHVLASPAPTPPVTPPPAHLARPPVRMATPPAYLATLPDRREATKTETVSKGEVSVSTREDDQDVHMMEIEQVDIDGQSKESDDDIIDVEDDISADAAVPVATSPAVTCATTDGNKSSNESPTSTVLPSTEVNGQSDTASVQPVIENGGGVFQGVIRSNGLSPVAAVCNGSTDPVKLATAGSVVKEGGDDGDVGVQVVKVDEGAAAKLAEAESAQAALDKMLSCFVPCLPDESDIRV